MRKSALLLLSMLALTACQQVSVKQIQGPDGTMNQLISCPYAEQCYEKATQLCGHYKIVNTSSDTWSLGGKDPTQTTTHMLVKCETP